MIEVGTSAMFKKHLERFVDRIDLERYEPNTGTWGKLWNVPRLVGQVGLNGLFLCSIMI